MQRCDVDPCGRGHVSRAEPFEPEPGDPLICSRDEILTAIHRRDSPVLLTLVIWELSVSLNQLIDTPTKAC